MTAFHADSADPLSNPLKEQLFEEMYFEIYTPRENWIWTWDPQSYIFNLPGNGMVACWNLSWWWYECYQRLAMEMGEWAILPREQHSIQQNTC